MRGYEEKDAEAWDKLVAESWNGTFLHTRRFLSSHGERFRDLSLAIEDGQGRMVGVFPAALDPAREDLVVSHPGLTYGGIVHSGRLKGPMMIEALRTITEAYRAIGLRSLRCKAVPYIYHRIPSADDLYALFRLEAVRYRCDLAGTIDLSFPQKLRKRRRYDLNKARRVGVQVAFGPGYLEPFWAVLEERLAARHGTRPAHTLEEIIHLQSMFPEQIECVVGTLEDKVVAGVVLFRTPRAVHVQYSANTATHDARVAQTLVVEYAIEKSRAWGARYFDYGTSNECEGKVLNEGLHDFKTSFGAGGVVYEFYELELNREYAERGLP